jgi:sugar-specific transcriptional regulator TrmB
MSAKDPRLEDMERELNEALEKMDRALSNANGECSKKIREGRRTTRVRRALKKLAEEG